MESPKVFISYSHKDEPWKNRLVTHLGVLAREGILEVWDDRRIGAGEDWYPDIQEAMDQANVAILMVSADFLNSDFILQEEVPRLMQRRAKEGLRVFPVIVKPCAWKQVGWLAELAVRPKDGEPLSAGTEHEQEENLAAIAEEVARIVRPVVARNRGDGFAPLPPEKVSLAKLPSTSPDLFGREKELALLDAAWEKNETNVVTLVAWGGVGKTALVNVLLNQMARDNFRGAERVFGWSFYSQGAVEGRQVSADLFIATALRWFGDPDPTAGSPWDKGERLAELIRQQRTLLVLDGLEPLQNPPGLEEGRIKDPALQSLLRELAVHNSGLCIITTRLNVDDVKDFTAPTLVRQELEHLSPEAGAKVLENLEVKGTPEELQEASKDFGGHALALTLLGGLLRDAYDGDIRRRGEVGPLEDDTPQGAHAKRVIEAYEKWLGEGPALCVLRLIGLFDRPAEAGAIAVLRAEPPIPGLTGSLPKLTDRLWRQTLATLRRARLLAEKNPADPDSLDAHPLIREHFGEKNRTQNPNAWKEAHRRLYEYYKSKPEKEFPDTFEEMAPLYAAVTHGCQAGLYQEALDNVYCRRIQRGNKYYNRNNLGAFGAELATLHGFFDPPWRRPVAGLEDADKAFVLNEAGSCLRALGRLKEAVEPMRAGFGIHLGQNAWDNAAILAGNLSELHLTIGDVTNALDFARRSVELAERTGKDFQRMLSRAILADALHQSGCFVKAEAAFREAEEMQEKWQPQFPLLYSVQGFYYCGLLLGQGKYGDLRNRVEQTLEWVSEEHWLLDISLDHLSLGRVCLLQAVEEGTADFSKAADHLNQAGDGLRQAGTQHALPRGLLARAELFRVTGEFARAGRDLDEAMRIATRGGMRLYEADCHLEYARLHLAQGKLDEGRSHLDTAREMIEEMGYHRRDPEILLETARLKMLEGDTVVARQTLAAAKKKIDDMGCHRWDHDAAELEEKLKDN